MTARSNTQALWRYAPALLFAATPAIAWWGNAYKFTTYDGLSYWDWEVISFSSTVALMLAAFAAVLADKFDRPGAVVLSASAISAAWIAFLTPASSGGGAALVALAGILIWLLCALSLWGYGWRHGHKINWVTQPLLVVAAFITLWCLGHEILFVYAPMLLQHF